MNTIFDSACDPPFDRFGLRVDVLPPRTRDAVTALLSGEPVESVDGDVAITCVPSNDLLTSLVRVEGVGEDTAAELALQSATEERSPCTPLGTTPSHPRPHQWRSDGATADGVVWTLFNCIVLGVSFRATAANP